MAGLSNDCWQKFTNGEFLPAIPIIEYFDGTNAANDCTIIRQPVPVDWKESDLSVDTLNSLYEYLLTVSKSKFAVIHSGRLVSIHDEGLLASAMDRKRASVLVSQLLSTLLVDEHPLKLPVIISCHWHSICALFWGCHCTCIKRSSLRGTSWNDAFEKY